MKSAQGIIPPINRITNWITALGFTFVLWYVLSFDFACEWSGCPAGLFYKSNADRSLRPCRISILFSIVRVTNPSQYLRRVAFFVGCSFIIMWAAIMVQKIRICQSTCMMAASVGLSQLLSPFPIVCARLVGVSITFSDRDGRRRPRRTACLLPSTDGDEETTADHVVFGLFCVAVDPCDHDLSFCRSFYGHVE